MPIPVVLVASQAASEAEPEPTSRAKDAPKEKLPFVGTWTSQLDGSLLELTPTTFHLRFQYQEGTRDNDARILSTLAFSRTTFRDRTWSSGTRASCRTASSSQVDDEPHYVLYEIRGNTLRKYVSPNDFPEAMNDEVFVLESSGPEEP